MPLTKEEMEAAQKRLEENKKRKMMEADPSITGTELSKPLQPENTTGSGASSSNASASNANAPEAAAPAAAANVLAMEPKFLLDDDQVSSVLVMGKSTLVALAAELHIDVSGDSKAKMIGKIIRFTGECVSVKKFDVKNDKFEFEGLKKQDFQQPAVQQS